jgi:hypothetical protein
VQEGADQYLQLSLSSWRVRSSYEIQVSVRHGGHALYALRAAVPISHISFKPRILSKEALTDLRDSFDCHVYEQANFDAAKHAWSDCNSLNAQIGRRSSDGRWLKIKVPSSGHEGWIPLPPRDIVLKAFPEHALIPLIASFNEYLRFYAFVPVRTYQTLRGAYADVRRAAATGDASALRAAETIIGTVEMLQGARLGEQSLHERAASHFESARRLSDSSELRNLQLLNSFLACCSERITSVDQDDRIDIVIDARGRYQEHLAASAAEWHRLLDRDPASSTVLFNAYNMMLAATDANVPVDGLNVALERVRLKTVLAARQPSPAASCRLLEQQSSRASR